LLLGKVTQKLYKLTVSSRDNQTEEIKEMMKSQINPAEMKVGIEAIKTLRGGRVQIETGSIQEAKTLENCITDKLGDKIETHIQRPRKTRLKIINIDDTVIA